MATMSVSSFAIARQRASSAWSGLRRSRPATIGFAIVAIHLVLAVGAPLVAPYSPTDIDPMATFDGPSWRHPMGTDRFGRDGLSRVIHGGRYALAMSLIATAIALAAGATIGLILGYVGGLVDEGLMRLFDAQLSLPSILLLLVILTTFGSGLDVIIPATALLYMPGVVRVARAAALDVAPREFVLAARSRGETTASIVRRELFPNVLDVLLVEFAMRASWVVLLISSLSFLGFGINPPTPDWGLMVNENRPMMGIAPWGTIFPMIAIGSLVVGLNLLSDGIAKSMGLDRTRGTPQ